MTSPAEIIRCKREGGALDAEHIQAFVDGLTDRSWSEGQVAALAMAICWRGMDRAECMALTRAMAHSGEVLDWTGGLGPDVPLSGPVLDKHSSGGVGDKTSLIIAPILAACGAVVPMVSGRGLGHTGGTLDKLQSLPGYAINPSRSQLRKALREAGCAIVGASARMAPADRRLYAIRDVTGTVESLSLITASILSKKLAAGLHGLVMDVKVGNGAFCRDQASALALAQSIVDVAQACGLPARALITDMNQVLGSTAGNALEVQEAIAVLTGTSREPRLLAVCLALCAQALHLGGLAPSVAEGERLAERALVSGAAAERFARMVAALGGPSDVLRAAALPVAPVRLAVTAPRTARLVGMDTLALGLAVVALGGGRRKASDAVDPRVGLSGVAPLGQVVQRGEAALHIHAATPSAAQDALVAVQAALVWADADAPQPAVGRNGVAGAAAASETGNAAHHPVLAEVFPTH